MTPELRLGIALTFKSSSAPLCCLLARGLLIGLYVEFPLPVSVYRMSLGLCKALSSSQSSPRDGGLAVSTPVSLFCHLSVPVKSFGLSLSFLPYGCLLSIGIFREHRVLACLRQTIYAYPVPAWKRTADRQVARRVGSAQTADNESGGLSTRGALSISLRTRDGCTP